MIDVPGYQLERLIGRGASGEVWLAHQRAAAGRTVALKCIAMSEGAAIAGSLQTEGQLLASLEHPNIVTLYDVVPRSGGVALVMQYAGGGSLASLLGQRRLTPGQVVSIAAPLADALDYAHARGVVHGDVTPANVLFTDDSRPLLADFGIARVAARLSARSGLVGTPHYLDPHVALGRQPDAASDIYALGAICYEALAGRPPYVGSTPFELLRRAREGDRPPLAELAPDVPPALAAVVERALSVEPQDRYQRAEEFAGGLRNACPPEPVALLPRYVPVEPEAPARPTREFGPRPPVKNVIPSHRARRGAWDVAADFAESRWARATALVVVTALALVAVGVLVLSRGDDAPSAQSPSKAPLAVAAEGTTHSSSTTPAPPPPSSATSAATATGGNAGQPAGASEWAEILAVLDERRSEAYRAADVALLSAVYVPGAALQADSKLVAGLAKTKRHVEDLQLVYKDVRVIESDAKHAVLDVTDELPAYTLVDAGGKVLQAYPARGPKRWRITLVGSQSGWRISTISPVK